MDPNMLKFLEEGLFDLDLLSNSISSSYDDTRVLQKPSNSDRGHTPSQLLHQWQTSGHDGNVNSIVKIQQEGKDGDTQMHKLQNMINQQPITTDNQQSKLNKVPFGMLFPIIQTQLNKDKAMQLHTLYFKLKKNEISKDGFVRHMRSIVGDQMLKMAAHKVQMQAPKISESTNAASATSLPPQPYDSQMRQASPNQNPNSNHLGFTN